MAIISIFIHAVKHILTYVVVLAGYLLHTPAPAQEARLAYQLQPGEKYRVDIDLQQNTYSESINSEQISLSSRTLMDFHVDSLDELNRIHMTVAYQDLHLSMLAPQLHMDLNSGKSDNQMLSEMMDSLEKGTFQVIMAPNGQLQSLEGLAEQFDSLSAFSHTDTSEYEVILSTLKEVYGPNSFQSLVNLFLSVYPVFESMSNWTHDFTYFFNTKPVKMMNRYYLSRSTDEELTIQGIGMLNAMKEFHETTGMGEVKSTVSGSQTYDFQMDRETGWIRRCVSRQRLVIETIILKSSYLPTGLKIPSYTETLFEVKGTRLHQDMK
jgi:hypothetical protein